MSRIHRFVSASRLLLISSVLLLTTLGLAGSGDVRATEGSKYLGEPRGLEEHTRASEPQRVREVVGLRAADSKTYELATGQLEWVSDGSPIHYKDSLGRWQEIDSRVIADGMRVDGFEYAFRNAANSSTVRFGAKASENQVRVECKGKSITFGPTGAK